MSKRKSDNINEDTTKELIPIIKPKTKGQSDYIKSIEKNIITICLGPAGSGKTYLAAAKAVEYLRLNKVDKILITRAAVESFHEKLGALPGYLEEKYNLYTVPISEELSKVATSIELKLWKGQNKIEFSPIAPLRGRTFHRTFIIVEEASSCTLDQLTLIATRFGQGSKMVIAGDLKQSDLRREYRGGLEFLCERLDGCEDIGIVHLHYNDIVRNDLIGEILRRIYS